ncbi:hypothetical protein R1sor_013087 [Riccia sorocarpa]|uniref:Uncharacterized protein n=1 Tax=Riccia sorocarpa TaxID=122646 RepID=A0ABD3H5I1_9MARC
MVKLCILLSLFLLVVLLRGGEGYMSRRRIPCHEILATQNTEKSLYIIYMEDATPTDQAKLSQKNALLQVLGSEVAAEKSIIYTYDRGFRGFAALLSAEEAEMMRSLSSVIFVVLSRLLEVQTTASYSYLGFKTLEGVWPESNYGNDTIVGLLDTGIWPESESFDDYGMSPVPATWKGRCVEAPGFGPEKCNRKIIGARYYDKGYRALYGPLTSKHMNGSSPRDFEGHGSHTASTAVGRRVVNASLLGLAQGIATGGAPLARLAVYKVCWSQGCSDADILAAFNDAVEDGVDILSLSIGGNPADYQYDSIAIGAFHAARKGILVVASAGNDGPFEGSVLNISPWFLTVAAGSINRQFLAKVVLGNGDIYQGTTINTFTMEPGKMYPLVYGGDIPAQNFTSDSSRFCSYGTLDKEVVKGKIVVCFSSFIDENDDVIYEAGGVGLITMDELEEQIAFPFSIPASSVDLISGYQILRYINTTKAPTARIERTETIFNAAPAPVVASFSSIGPNIITPDILKPDMIAPGLDILAAWSPLAPLTPSLYDTRKVKYNIISGTSMSCPHITGAAAVIKSLHPDWSPAAIKSALMTTATPLNQSINGDNMGLATGSGMVNPASFTDPGLVYDIILQDYTNFLCSIGYTTKQLQLFAGDKSVCPKLTPKVQDLNYPSIMVTGNRTMSQTVTRTLSNVGPEISTYTVSVTNPRGVRIIVSPATLSFNATNKKRKFAVYIKTARRNDDYVFGSLTWSDGAHSVRIPVGAGPRSPYELKR